MEGPQPRCSGARLFRFARRVATAECRATREDANISGASLWRRNRRSHSGPMANSLQDIRDRGRLINHQPSSLMTRVLGR